MTEIAARHGVALTYTEFDWSTQRHERDEHLGHPSDLNTSKPFHRTAAALPP